MYLLDAELLAQNIEKRIESDLAEGNLCGVSVLVKQYGKRVYKKHFGNISPKSDTPVSDQTLFRLASMTKPITAVATMILVDRGLLSLDDAVEKYVPSFSSPFILNEEGERVCVSEKITIKHILTHSSGIGSGPLWNKSCASLTKDDASTIERFVNFISRQPLSFVPGTKSEYSGVAAFSLLTHIIEKVSGKDMERFLKDEIFIPCEMDNTTFSPSTEQWEKLIVMHNKENGVSTIGKTGEGCVFSIFPTTNPLGGAGLISSLADYENFADMLANRGVFKGKRIISEESFEKMTTPQIPPHIKPGKERWGLGVRVIVSDEYARLPISAFGWSGAYGTHFWVDPVNQVVGIYMKNSFYDGGSGAKTAAMFEKDVSASFRK